MRNIIAPIIDSIIRIIDRVVIPAPIDDPERIAAIEAVAFIAIPAW